jgi:hypothetical protein
MDAVKAKVLDEGIAPKLLSHATDEFIEPCSDR